MIQYPEMECCCLCGADLWPWADTEPGWHGVYVCKQCQARGGNPPNWHARWLALRVWATERRATVVSGQDYRGDHGAGLYVRDGIDEVLARMAKLEEEP